MRQIDKGTSPPWSYLTALLDRFAPWPLLLAGALFAAPASGWRRVWGLRDLEVMGAKGRRVAPLLVLWIAVPLILFSLAQTHHHWYMDPVYPALAAATAGALLFLLRRISPARRGAALFALFLLPLALCEVRLLARVLVRDQMPESQRFLISLKGRHAELGHELHAATSLYHSERFILEAMDGYRVVEGPGDGPPAGASPDMPLLARKAAAARGIQPAPDFEVLAQNLVYTLYGNTNLDLEAGRLQAPKGRSHLLKSLFRQIQRRRGRGVRRS